MSSFLEDAGFTLPESAPPADIPRATAASPGGSGSMLETAGFSLPAGSGAQSTAQTPATKPLPLTEQSVFQNLVDSRFWGAAGRYLANIPHAMLETAKYPGDVMQGNKPITPEDALAVAGMGLGGIKFGGAAAAAAVEQLGPSAQAVNRLVDAIGPENVPAVVARTQTNPRLTLADTSDQVRTMTQGLIDPAQPKAQGAIVSAVDKRVKGAPDAVNSAYTQAMGPAPDVVQMVEGLKARARAAGQKAIQPALENAKPVDVSPVVSAINEKLQPGINALLDPKTQLPLSDFQKELVRLKQELVSDNGETLFDAQRLHRVQSDLGDKAYQLSKSPDPKDRMLGSQLRDVNEKLIDQIDEASGGAYRPARAQFKDAKDISEAFESGFDTLKNRQGLAGAMEDSPAAFKKWMDQATPEEVVARRLGTRADIDQKIRTAQNQALKGEQITRIEYNRDKLGMLFGADEASRLVRAMEDTRLIAHTNSKLLEGAKTAETQAGQRALAVPKVGGGNPLQYVAPIGAEILSSTAGLPGVGFAASMAGRGIQLGVQKAAQVNALMRNAEFAKAAMATGPERSVVFNKLLAHPKVRAAANP